MRERSRERHTHTHTHTHTQRERERENVKKPEMGKEKISERKSEASLW